MLRARARKALLQEHAPTMYARDDASYSTSPQGPNRSVDGCRELGSFKTFQDLRKPTNALRLLHFCLGPSFVLRTTVEALERHTDHDCTACTWLKDTPVPEGKPRTRTRPRLSRPRTAARRAFFRLSSPSFTMVPSPPEARPSSKACSGNRCKAADPSNRPRPYGRSRGKALQHTPRSLRSGMLVTVAFCVLALRDLWQCEVH